MIRDRMEGDRYPPLCRELTDQATEHEDTGSIEDLGTVNAITIAFTDIQCQSSNKKATVTASAFKKKPTTPPRTRKCTNPTDKTKKPKDARETTKCTTDSKPKKKQNNRKTHTSPECRQNLSGYCIQIQNNFFCQNNKQCQQELSKQTTRPNTPSSLIDDTGTNSRSHLINCAESPTRNSTDMIPRIHKRTDRKRSNQQVATANITPRTKGNKQTRTQNNLTKFFGPPPTTREEKIIRIFYNNCNGLEPTRTVSQLMKANSRKTSGEFLGEIKNGSKLDNIMTQLLSWQTNIACLAETGVAWDNMTTKRAFQKIAKAHDRRLCMTTSSAKTNFTSHYKPGGTATLVDGVWSSNIVERGEDPHNMGRWSFITLAGRKKKLLTIITAYRTSKKAAKHVGPNTAVAHQALLLRANGRQIGTAAACITDLEEFISNLQSDGNDILLAIDANEKFSNDANIAKMAARLGLTNVMKALYKQFPPTKPSSGRTIDHVLCTEKVLRCITNASIVPYNLSLGDHRGILIDVDVQALLHTSEKEMHHVGARRLDTRNTRAVRKYKKILKKGLKNHNIHDRLEKLNLLVNAMKQKKESVKEDIILQYNKLDRDIHRLCKNAEKNCRKLVSTASQFSKETVQNRNKQYLLEAIRRRQRKGLPVQSKYTDMANAMNIKINVHVPEEVEKELKTIYRYFNKASDTECSFRTRFLQERAIAYAKDNNMNGAKAVEELLKHERTRNVFGFMKHQMKSSQRSQLKKIWINQKDPRSGEMKKTEVHDEAEMADAILHRNRTHLRQAKNTPFAQSTLGKQLGPDGSGQLAEEILGGRWRQSGEVYPWVIHYIKCMAAGKPEILESVNGHITVEDYKKFWKRKRESTTTSPFGLHVGHYKVAASSKSLVDIQRSLMTIPFEIGFVPTRWRKTVQLMLEKDPGRPWIHRLRIIELFDAQLNAALQMIIGQRLVYNAIKHNMIHRSAFGSVPGKTASAAVLHKLLQVENIAINRKSGALFECDATGCYDRILPSLQGIHTRRLGLSTNAAHVASNCLILSERHIGTKHGTSNEKYRSTETEPLYGVGQGSGAGPAIWLAHLTVMLDAISKKCAGVISRNPQESVQHTSNGNGYVDDCNILSEVDKHKATETEVVKVIQQDAQWWERILHSNGGKLEVSKCFWYSVLWKWSSGTAVQRKVANKGVPLTLIQSENNEPVLVEQRCVSQPTKVLGVHMSMNGSWKQEYDRWVENANTFAGKLRRGKLGRICGYLAYNNLWIPKVRYVAGLIDFSRSQCNKIQSPVVSAALSTAGYNQKFPRSIVHGPLVLGGMDWESLCTTALIEITTLALKHVKADDEVGKMIRINLDTVQLKAGISTPVLEYDKELPGVGKNWIKTLHDRLAQNNMKMIVWGVWVPSKQRTNDKIIMDEIIPHHTDREIKMIQQCRIYLKAVTLADITDESGQMITENAWNVSKGEVDKPHRLKWPYQQRPSRSAISLWRQALKRLGHNHRKLHQKLGKWLKPAYKVQPFEIHHGKLLRLENNTIKEHDNIGGTIYFRLDGVAGRLTRDAMPVQGTKSPFGWKIFLNTEEARPIPREIQSMDMKFYSLIDKLPQFMQKTIGRITGTCLDNLEEVWNHKTIIAATDGGLKEKIGSHGYLLVESGSHEPFIRGYGAEQALYKTMTSTREELIAMLAVHYLLKVLQQLYGKIDSPNIFFLTDSEAAQSIRKKEVGSHQTVKWLDKEMDVESEIRRMEKVVGINAEIIWTKAHVTGESENPYYTMLNEMADALATEARVGVENGSVDQVRHDIFPGTKIALSVNGFLIHNNRKEIIRRECHYDTLKMYICEKFGWNDQRFYTVDWDALGRALRGFQQISRPGILKYLHGWQFKNRQKKKFGLSPRDPNAEQCPLCNEEETVGHEYTCKAPQMIKARKTGWKLFRNRITSFTEPEVIEKIWFGIHSVTDDHSPDPGKTYSDSEREVAKAFERQNEIGWDKFLRGFVAMEWGIVNYAISHEAQMDPTTWTAKIVRELWTMGLGLWAERNAKLHGNQWSISLEERSRSADRIRELYREVKPIISTELQWLFNKSVKMKLQESYAAQTSWIEQVESSCKSEIEKMELNNTRTKAHVEYVRNTGIIGNNYII